MGLGTVRLSDNKAATSLKMQEKYLTFNMEKATFVAGDVFQFYLDSTLSDCYKPNLFGSYMQFYNMRWNGVPFISPIWFGTKTGFTGVSTTNPNLQLCYYAQDVSKLPSAA